MMFFVRSTVAQAVAQAVARAVGPSAALALALALPLVQAQPATPASTAPALRSVLAEVLDADPQVRAARSNVAIAEARSRQARSRYWPSAGMTGVAGQSTDREFSADIDRRTERLEAVLRWNLYSGGVDRVEIAATEREIASAQFELDRTRGEAAERMAEAWLEAQRLRAVAAASRRRLHDVATLTNQIASQGAAGRVAESDVLQARASLSETQVNHELAVAEAEAAQARLEILVGRPVFGFVPAGFPALAVPEAAMHPAVKAARERAEAAAARQRKLAEALAPRLDFELRHRLLDRTDPAPTTSQRRGALVSMTWDVPLGGATFAQQDEAQRRVDAARAEAERVDMLLRADLAALRQRERTAADALDRTRAGVEQSRTLLRAALVQFEAGRRSVQQLIQSRDAQFAAEQRFADAQARLQQLRMRQWSAAGSLLAALGLDPGGVQVAAAESPQLDLSPAAMPMPALTVTPQPSGVSEAGVTTATAGNRPPATATAARADGSSAVAARLAAWVAAWKSRDIDAYLAFYSRAFVPAKGLTRAQWEAQRRRVLGQGGVIELDVVQPAYTLNADTANATFEQRYRSPTFNDSVRKRVDWVMEAGQWRIVRETAL